MPRAGTNWTGSAALVVETDPLEAFPVLLSEDAPRLIANSEVSAMGPVWAPLSVTFRRDPADTKLYYASSSGAESVRDVTQAKVMLWSDWADVNIGYVFVEYEIDFFYPELEIGNAFYATQYTHVPITVDMAGSVGSPITLTATPGFMSIDNNLLYEIVLATTEATGGFANLLAGTLGFASSPWRAGKILYGAVMNSKLYLYNSIQQAIGASADNAIVNGATTAITGVASYMWARAVRARGGEL